MGPCAKVTSKELIRALTHKLIASAECACEDILRDNHDVLRHQLNIIKLYEEILPLVEKKVTLSGVLSHSEQTKLDQGKSNIHYFKDTIAYYELSKNNKVANLTYMQESLADTVKELEGNQPPLLVTLLDHIQQFFLPCSLS